MTDIRGDLERLALKWKADAEEQGAAGRVICSAMCESHALEINALMLRIDAIFADALNPAESVPARVKIEFPGIGMAGPFTVLDGELTLPGMTMEFLAYHFRRGYSLEAPDETNKDIAVAQAVEFAQYVVDHAKGRMVEAAERFLSLPYSQDVALRLAKAVGDNNGK